jgi:plasmid stabilization system protein ParE
MKNGYKILWTLHALKELEKTIDNLNENWTEKELQTFALNLEKTINLISINPFIFQPSDIKKEIRRAVILSLNSLYYRINEDNVEIISFFSNRQNPKRRNLI